MTIDALHATPIGRKVESLQDAGRDIYIAGFSTDGGYALIVDNDNDQVSVAPVSTVNGLGRWECSAIHRRHYSDLYAQRFPLH